MVEENQVNKETKRALQRMRNAHEKGRGVRLSWAELHDISTTLIGEWWQYDADEEVDVLPHFFNM
ncbi:MAG: hypothetical protein E3J46_12785 [Desulfobacteraceae bacterium]|nr:MAG: hypothetical protein E3J46_12785 [Desulfobacteraceae bacterium]